MADQNDPLWRAINAYAEACGGKQFEIPDHLFVVGVGLHIKCLGFFWIVCDKDRLVVHL